MTISGESEVYAECQRLMDMPPLSELHLHVSKGHGSIIRLPEFGGQLVGMKCSDEQLIRYMEQHGFYHTSTDSWSPNRHSYGKNSYDYNKRLSFCTSRNILGRLIFGNNCEVGAMFKFLDDEIVEVGAAGNK